MKIIRDISLKRFASRLSVPLYVVGGQVRNALLGVTGGDIDICAAAPPEEICAAAREEGFSVGAVYGRTGTVRLTGGGRDYEYSPFRVDSYFGGAHRPAAVIFTGDIDKDARRRDFTANAVYCEVLTGKIVDPLGGDDDIRAKLMRRCSPSTFEEDGLRLMRLVRFAAQTGFYIERQTLKSARENAPLIGDISAERKYSELMLMLSADSAYPQLTRGLPAHFRALLLMYYTGLMRYLLPEVYALRGVLQPPQHHCFDVFMHTLRAVMYSPIEVRLAALLHDIGKPIALDKTGRFIGHESDSADICEDILKKRLNVPGGVYREVMFLVRNHMYDGDMATSERKRRRFIVSNSGYIDKLAELMRADALATGKISAAQAELRVDRLAGLMARMRCDGTPLSLKQLAVNGADMIQLGAVGEQIGRTLEYLHKMCAANPELNHREILLKHAAGYIKKDKKSG